MEGNEESTMLAQYACQQLFNHENHTLIFAGINTRSQHFKYYITVRNKSKSCREKITFQ